MIKRLSLPLRFLVLEFCLFRTRDIKLETGPGLEGMKEPNKTVVPPYMYEVVYDVRFNFQFR